MSDYNELVKALRETPDDWYDADLHRDAAAAIEELIESVHIRDKISDELTRYICKLEAQGKRLKECNDELREAQTYIDHYGDRWMTSAKDVPTAAYEHGYADGRDEAEAQLPKRGEWIVTTETSDDGAVSQHINCSVCGFYWREPKHGKVFKRCPNCGAKMEVGI